MSYRLIVGLGNPGSEYEATRHNIGFRVVDALALKLGADSWKKDRKFKAELSSVSHPSYGKLILAKPTTFMNQSGVCVQKLCSFHKIPPEEVIVIYDEINLSVGELKLSMAGSAGGHNGLSDILARIAPRFARIRVGIGGKPHKEMPLADYVLGKFSSDDESVISDSLARYVNSIDLLLSHGADLAMNQINRKRKNDDSNSI
ncbi:aminoacyl-tRNA hydrolase [Pelagicoccus albus]|uniref:Peptidyl-tRNA hydrolase n=1 Tax=Pelagicoccus albus TaxID=415222 RepID=A0A7X1B2V1_9BACT|nr:aminoacyl-tRNA hydrolase [Pelagicoccus albus]MBC2604628.1 aminoacyl-tRNA hydrolase [Pelagicoccus albus]